ncbi:TPR repeat-containing protein [Ectocarpus siliculosus]|uniref:TPR repeat-containing protein n=1 Tax=Ectocarpus siliculosus TaxID=2880 RepID=D8LPW2_ECTSI|nr:TPR repeat-containing protein [Ectocarpus siliculosus]|eukprot:CBN74854.1 TPR repeat-containing protein [Ectocarpus siliculosus]
MVRSRCQRRGPRGEVDAVLQRPQRRSHLRRSVSSSGEIVHGRVRGLLESQGKYDEGDPLYLRAIEIGEKTLGPDHPALATSLNNRARMLEAQGKHNEAIPLLERASSIRRKRLGGCHHSTVDTQITLERVQKHVREETN